ncbi:hypothetical protein [Streptomyces sp. NPDC086023]|uniref:hypothetical protein n=1 Tax=Streptomyces sp. NPDC086023 TaxID=3365746 RepID=UPI0037D07AB5
MPEPLPDDIAELLDILLNLDDPVQATLRTHVPHMRVENRCTCGCGTAYFALDTGLVSPADSGPGRVVAAERLIVTDDGDCRGEVLVFAEDGYLSWLEVCDWSDGAEVTLTLALQTLRPARNAP